MRMFWVICVVYFIFAALWFPWATHSLPALISVLTLLIIVSYGLTKLTFICYRAHIPVVVLLLLITMLSYRVFDLDHYFPTEKRENNWISLEKAFENRIKNKKTVTLVTATGGGIQAAAWTAEVLFGLEELLGKEFTDSP